MKRVAERSSKPDVKVMALFIREKLGPGEGSKHWQQGAKISPDLNVLPPQQAAVTRLLSDCTCAMTRGMRCTCGASERARAVTAVPRTKGDGMLVGGGKPARRKYGAVVLEPAQVKAKVQEMGGLVCACVRVDLCNIC
jgi:hypothetical protein